MHSIEEIIAMNQKKDGDKPWTKETEAECLRNDIEYLIRGCVDKSALWFRAGHVADSDLEGLIQNTLKQILTRIGQ